ncbi:protein kinase [Bradyrhizobium pachyrhizi]|uniref:Protein kinase n=1 Tax=Bradyrhizobium pachyrhizi TaxID=280333 RepID=A0A844SSF3_9BRAD|nr:serine/threonine-protein kinase [Bradyrhizobium pachyrhizi]MVT70023.1 protein kinase [Bradyrhizobium pachyrhizi]
MLIANRYEPTGNASWGGSGEVNECLDRNLGRKVMLKRVLRPSDYARLLDEQKALIRLRSKHVVQLLDVVSFRWNETDITCLVLEHIDGSNLEQLTLAPGPDYQKLLWQIARGLADIHAAGVIHRDVKPENIMRDAHGIVKIVDFGLAREIGKDDKTRSISGTRGFMAPELFGTSTISFTKAVDTYAFGRTALALLGRRPPSSHVPIPSGTVRAQFPALNSTTADIIEACLDFTATARPAMSSVAHSLAQELLRGRHRAQLIQAGTVHELNSTKPTLNITSSAGKITIQYDGVRFFVSRVSGNVFINNQRISTGMAMHSACVITFGNSSEARAFLPFDVSNPEIEL